jgi:hypothetical protein
MVPMGWRLELVQSEGDVAIERIAVCDIGEIVAPGGIDDADWASNRARASLRQSSEPWLVCRSDL